MGLYSEPGRRKQPVSKMTVCSSRPYYRVIYYRPSAESYYSRFFHKNLTLYLIGANGAGKVGLKAGIPASRRK
jgi:hypothetical protein